MDTRTAPAADRPGLVLPRRQCRVPGDGRGSGAHSRRSGGVSCPLLRGKRKAVIMSKNVNPDTPLPLEEMLRAVPLRNQAVRSDTRGEHELILRVPRRERWFTGPPFCWLFTVRREHGFGLDLLGREVWEACDGHRSVESIVDAFAARHGLGFHEARVGVTEFLKLLTRRGLVVVAGAPVPKGDA
ncbi:MAG: PqqD family peptide modification chaperone [Chitinivibrionales bacterium]|nr:PqqD family peptide modification chaperone [Chitinivibrionales bacterium]